MQQQSWRCPVCWLLHLGFVIPQCRNGQCDMRMVPTQWLDWFSVPKTVLTEEQCRFDQREMEGILHRAAHNLGLKITVTLRGDGGIDLEVSNPPERNDLDRLLQSRKPLLT